MKIINRKKILFFVYNFGNGGSERTILNILNYIDYDKFEPILCIVSDSNQNSYLKFLNDGVKVIRLNVSLKKGIIPITKVIRNEKPDIVFSTVYKMNIVVYFALKLSIRKAKLILRESSFIKNISRLEKFLIKFTYNRCDKVVALSKGVKSHLIEFFKVKEPKIEMIYNPIDIKEINEKMEENLDEEFSRGKLNIISCGRLNNTKNFQLLISSLNNVNIDKNKWTLRILGKGKNREKLHNLVRKYHLEENIFFLGFKKNPYKYMKNSDLFILSSLFEGFGHVVVESMACGTPVLSTDCPYGPSEILDNGKYGWLVPNNDEKAMTSQIEFLIKNPEEINKMKTKMHERVNFFNANRIVAEYEKMFFEL